MSLISCQDVAFSYEGKVVLSGINFQVNQGDYLCIIGENGAGKSTLMKGLLNLKKPSSGAILTGEGFAQNEIGYLPQQTMIQKDFPASVMEVVLSGRLNSCKGRFFYSKKDKEEAVSCLERLEILSLKNKCYRELSGGQQQRVLLARALCATKRLLLLDEPVTGLDPMMSAQLYRLIKQLNTEEKITIVMVSHDVKEVLSFANQILHLGQEQIFFGSKEAYLNTKEGRFFVGGEQC